MIRAKPIDLLSQDLFFLVTLKDNKMGGQKEWDNRHTQQKAFPNSCESLLLYKLDKDDLWQLPNIPTNNNNK